MKIIPKITFIILFFTQIILAQQQDLYILYDDCSIHKLSETKNDSLVLESYQIRFREKLNTEYKLSFSESGKLIKTPNYISGKSYPVLSIIYSNENNDNAAIKVTNESMNSKIWAETIINTVGTDFSTFFEKFDNIYLVDGNDKESKHMIAKKVKVRFLSPL